MLFDNSIPVWILPVLGLVALLARLARNKYGYGIASVPGPFWAAYTNLWRFLVTWGGRAERTHIQLHDKYGSLVRLGPNCVSISDPEAIKVIYGLTATYMKVRKTNSLSSIQPWLTVADSPIFTLFSNRPCLEKATSYKACSIPQMRNTMPS